MEVNGYKIEPKADLYGADLTGADLYGTTLTAANLTRLDHSTWLATPGRGGKAHRQTSMRQIRPFSPFAESEFPKGWMDEYLERWDLLESLTSET